MAERALWRAEIDQAVQDVLDPQAAFPGASALEAAEGQLIAIRWIESDDFVLVCRAAEVDVAAARALVAGVEAALC